MIGLDRTKKEVWIAATHDEEARPSPKIDMVEQPVRRAKARASRSKYGLMSQPIRRLAPAVRRASSHDHARAAADLDHAGRISAFIPRSR